MSNILLRHNIAIDDVKGVLLTMDLCIMCSHHT